MDKIPNYSKIITSLVVKLYGIDQAAELDIPEAKFGDYSSNIALQITKLVGKPPRDIAEQIASELRSSEGIASVEVAGPGFINFRLSDDVLVKRLLEVPTRQFAGQTIICEYSDMNAFKTAHVGHLYTTLVGNAVANLLQNAGANVIRANFGGDVGLHVGRAMWAILKLIDGEPSKLNEVPADQRSAWVAARYIEGTSAYETDTIAKEEIIDTNKRVYELHESGDKESLFAKVYWTCREWSYEGFEKFYENLQLDRQADGRFFDYYPESLTAPLGIKLVKRGIDENIFTLSDGATVYEGEKDGLHTRVFLTKDGLPTYETKDLGLAYKKWQDYKYDQNIIITANDIVEYMKVVLRALSKLLPETDNKTTHLTHGLVKLSGGEKMSSRTGNVLLPEDVIDAARNATMKAVGKAEDYSVLGAIKYSFLKNRIGGDIIYDPDESVNIHGNSGPYLQYAYARAMSILRKSSVNPALAFEGTLTEQERLFARKLSHYSGVVEKAASELAPHIICTYLYELAQEFNIFYENNRVIGDGREALRLYLLDVYAQKLKSGLGLLGIYAPEKM